MARAPTVRRADLDRVLAALARAGQVAARVEVKPGGVVVIVPGPAPVEIAAANAPALTLVEDRDKPADLDQWRASRKQRGDRAAQGS